MSPDWAARLAAGQVTSVHADAVQRLRQTGWDAVPPMELPAVAGISLAAALVPPCRGWRRLMEHHFAIRIRAELEHNGTVGRADPGDGDDQATNPHELAQEL